MAGVKAMAELLEAVWGLGMGRGSVRLLKYLVTRFDDCVGQVDDESHTSASGILLLEMERLQSEG